SENLRDDRLAALARGEDAAGILALLGLRRPILFEDARKADHRAQKIVEVMRDAAGELADRLELARLRQLLLEALALALLGVALRHVAHHDDAAAIRDAAALDHQLARRGAGLERQLVPVLLRLHRLRQIGNGQGKAAEERALGGRVRARPERARRAVGIEHAAFRILDADAVFDEIE